MSNDVESLSILSALYSRHSVVQLKQYLDASNGNVERAVRAIDRGHQAIVTSKAKRRKVESGIKDWLHREGRTATGSTEVLVLSDSDDEEQPSTSTLVDPPLSTETKPPVKSAFTLLRPPRSFPSPQNTSTTIRANSTATHINLPPLRLTTPAMISKETRGLITLVENALPEELSSRLYVRMVEASRGTGKEDPSPCTFSFLYP